MQSCYTKINIKKYLFNRVRRKIMRPNAVQIVVLYFTIFEWLDIACWKYYKREKIEGFQK